MFDDVLVPTDGSDCARVAVRYAEDLASHYGATVHVVSVVDSRILDNAPHYEQVKGECIDLVDATCDELAEANLDAEPVVLTAVPHRAILDYVSEHGIDLVVMGTHGRTGVERYVLGSVAEKVVRLSDGPVLTVKTRDDGAVTYPYDDVLVPTDGSEGAAAAIELAVDVASTYGARLHALSVVDTASLGVDVDSSVVGELEKAARAAVEVVEERADQASVEIVGTAVEFGTPYGEIRSYVEERDVDLVVMGPHGRSGIERYLLGIVTEKTVRTSPVPVMTIRWSESS
jgi:nucleotide-binding universal stress UspA family protein